MSGSGLPLVAGSVDDLVHALLAGLERPAGLQQPDADEVGPTEHGLQTAALLAAAYPADHELQIAGLLHDVGHLVEPDRPERHAEVGGRFVALVLGPRVSDLVRLHVTAKRYLVSVDVTYRLRLSPGSDALLQAEGGPLDPAGISGFVAEPRWRDAVVLRRADESAKDPSGHCGSLADWIDTLEQLARVERRRWR